MVYGLPRAGKSTLAKGLARHLGAIFLRLDAIRDGLFRSELRLSEAKGCNYAVARALAAENLSLGHPVVVDGVPCDRTLRNGWRDLGARVTCRLAWAEINCSDAAERRTRVENRAASGRKGWKQIGYLKMAPSRSARHTARHRGRLPGGEPHPADCGGRFL